MVRPPLTPAQLSAGRRLGARLRDERGDRRLDDIARAAGISPETLRKIETGRLATPAFGIVIAVADVLGVDVLTLAQVYRDGAVLDRADAVLDQAG
jgi:transcriptional regulator with XRE-family HTH domain